MADIVGERGEAKGRRLAVFDLDGTLVDSIGAIVEGFEAACLVFGVPAPAQARVQRVVGLPLIDATARLFPELGSRDHETLTQAYKEAIIGMRRDGTIDEPLFPGAREAVTALGAADWRLGIATGKPMRGLVSTLTPHGLLDCFETLQTADRAAGKPDPEMLYGAMQETGAAAAETVMIGDTTFDMEMARNAGTHALGVAWGYHEKEELLEAGAHRVVSSFEELLGVAKALLEDGLCEQG